tara:strand:+ start:7096 stop:7806 length:711 start_codon:yes stop_codon:yes gene_type:complete
MNLYLDIETGPNRDVMTKLFPCPPFPTWDIGMAKIPGSVKKEETKLKHVEKQREAHAAKEPTWEEDHFEAVLEKNRCLLNPALSQVCAIGWKEGDAQTRIDLGGDTDERSLLTCLALDADRATRLIGWNIKGFDLPYLAFRMRVHGVIIPDIMKPQGRYYSSNVIDLMELCGSSQYGNNYKLKHAAVAFGLHACPEESGKNFWRIALSDPARAATYLRWDVDACHLIAQRFPEALR